MPTSDFARNPDWALDADALEKRIVDTLGDAAQLIEGLRLARALLGDAIASNMLLLGAAWQRGQIPLQLAAIERAIELNGTAVEMNRAAFTWGRRIAVDRDAVDRLALEGGKSDVQAIRFVPRVRQTTHAIVEHRSKQLVEHTGFALALRYSTLVERVRAAEARLGLDESLSRAVAHNYHRLLAIKDEWEVARLYAHPDFLASVKREFEGDFKLHFHLGAWPFAHRDAGTGHPVKAEVGPWLMPAFRLMAAWRGLRGTWLDPFRNNAERQLDRRLLADYELDVELLVRDLRRQNQAIAVRIASLPETIRGYGHVREKAAETALRQRSELMQEWQKASAFDAEKVPA